MNKEFLLGVALGMVGGAVLVVNSKKVKELVLKGEKEVKKKMLPAAENGNTSDSKDEQKKEETKKSSKK